MLYGLIGRKLGHSFSARFFNQKFKREEIAAEYKLFEMVDINSLGYLLHHHPDLYGLNVTIPYKSEILPLLDSITETAREIGAVNTVKVFRPKEPNATTLQKPFLIGHNTDAPGFREALLKQLDSFESVKNIKALVLGTGGASKAVVYALKSVGIEALIVSRAYSPGVITYENLNEEIVQSHRIVVNCTPLGMWPDIDSCPSIPYQAIDSRHLCFDLVYNPEMTLFMHRCRERGAKVCNGLEMLYNQANLAWQFWQCPIERKYMANAIEIHTDGNNIETYHNAIVSVTYAPDGRIIKTDVTEFSEEIHSVEFVDSPMILHLNKDDKYYGRS